ncbi:MAG: leucine-rich repeat domain-containing protein, partial [Defluviitaleaceae bacterium]|nr:leucine-rich repeat domain-containing protein [Defluviitaleaceae bacterium]
KPINKVLFVVPGLFIVVVAGFLLFSMFGGDDALDEAQIAEYGQEETGSASQIATMGAIDPLAASQSDEPEYESTNETETSPDYITIAGRRISTAETDLAFSHSNLTNDDIADLRYMTNLRSLSIIGEQISDLTPISGLTNLEFLTVESGLVSDLTPLANLTNLQALSLWSNQISNIAPLANLRNLETLHLTYNQITNIEPLVNLTNLLWLSLAGNNIVNIEPLANLPNLLWLNLWDNPITNWDFVDHVEAVRGQEDLYLTTANLNLRENPSTASASLGLFPPNTEVWVYEQAYPGSDWFFVTVRYGNNRLWGFMMSDFLTSANPIVDASDLIGVWDSWAVGRGIAAVVSATPFGTPGGGIGVMSPEVNPSHFYYPLKLEFDGDRVTATFELRNLQGGIIIGRQAGNQHSHFEVIESDDFWGYSYLVSSTMPFSVQGNRIEFLFHNRPSFIADFSLTQDILTIDGVQFNRVDEQEPTPVVEASTGRFTPGTFTGSGEGYSGSSSVRVTIVVDTDNIINITMDTDDTPLFAAMAADILIPAAIAAQGANIATVGGATFTSEGFIQALQSAINQAEN